MTLREDELKRIGVDLGRAAWQDSPKATLDTSVGTVTLHVNSATAIYVECEVATVRSVSARGNCHLHFHKGKWEPYHSGEEAWKCGIISRESSTFDRVAPDTHLAVPTKTRDAMVEAIVVAVSEWAAQNEAALYDAESIKEGNEYARLDDKITAAREEVEGLLIRQETTWLRASEARHKRDALLAAKEPK
jgi:hypothetical protein